MVFLTGFTGLFLMRQVNFHGAKDYRKWFISLRRLNFHKALTEIMKMYIIMVFPLYPLSCEMTHQFPSYTATEIVTPPSERKSIMEKFVNIQSFPFPPIKLFRSEIPILSNQTAQCVAFTFSCSIDNRKAMWNWINSNEAQTPIAGGRWNDSHPN